MTFSPFFGRPAGWVSDASTWLPAKPPQSKPRFIQVQNALLQTRNDGTTLIDEKNYSGGRGDLSLSRCWCL